MTGVDSTAARDRAIGIIERHMPSGWLTPDLRCQVADMIMDDLVAVPEVLRALAGVPAPDVAAAIRAKAADEALAMCCEGTGTCGAGVCIADQARHRALLDAADLAGSLLGVHSAHEPEEGTR